LLNRSDFLTDINSTNSGVQPAYFKPFTANANITTFYDFRCSKIATTVKQFQPMRCPENLMNHGNSGKSLKMTLFNLLDFKMGIALDKKTDIIFKKLRKSDQIVSQF